ncbi:hypothetical protein ACFE04_018060 [Oxalis oulophora]
MESNGGGEAEADRKRRHISSPTPPKKKQPSFFAFEQKTLDAAVLQFQNQKLFQKLETQKLECSALESKVSHLKLSQQPLDSISKLVNNSWEKLVTDLEARSIHVRESSIGINTHAQIPNDGIPSSPKDVFLSRLSKVGATETCSTQMEEDKTVVAKQTTEILHNIGAAVQGLSCLRNKLLASVLKVHREDGSCRPEACSQLESEVKSLSDLILEHMSLTRELQAHQDLDAKNKTELKRLQGELESTVEELEVCKLTTLRAEKETTKGAFFPVLNLSSKNIASDRIKDKQKDLHDMQSTFRVLSDEASSRLSELKNLHEERTKIFPQISNLQNSLKSVLRISSSQSYLLMRDQLEKLKAGVVQYQASFEKLQVERDHLVWRERELTMKNDLADVSRKYSAVAKHRISDLETEIHKQIEERNRIQNKLDKASKEPGRKQIIAEFKTVVSSFPEEMNTMQSQLNKYKEAAMDIHTVRANVQSFSSNLDWKTNECKNLSTRSAFNAAEIHELQEEFDDLNVTGGELKLFWEAYRSVTIDSREVLEAKESEYRAWAQVQTLSACLDEQSLELRVKAANEAEAISQQSLATAEAEFTDLRQRLEASTRDKIALSDVLKSKTEENESYLTEIETIGQAYDDMQAQNQQLLQQITERDDYDIKLVLEAAKARQIQATLIMDKRFLDSQIHQANGSRNLYGIKASRLEDQLKFCSDLVQKLTENRFQDSVTLENLQRKLSEVGKLSHQARASLEERQSLNEQSRSAHLELKLELEKQSFDTKRTEEELETVRRKFSRLQAQIEESTVLEKLRQELREYRDILKCGICLDRRKEVVITKCYHLFCNTCVQKICGTRQRKCPAKGSCISFAKKWFRTKRRWIKQFENLQPEQIVVDSSAGLVVINY